MKAMQAAEEKDIPDSITLGQLKALMPSNPKPRVSFDLDQNSSGGLISPVSAWNSNPYMTSGMRTKTRSRMKLKSSTRTLRCRRLARTGELGKGHLKAVSISGALYSLVSKLIACCRLDQEQLRPSQGPC